MSSNDGVQIQSYDEAEKMFLVKTPSGVVKVSDTFAEMFPLWAGRVLITAQNEKWAQIAASITTGFATSVIAASAEAAVERTVPASETPDKRPGILIQIYNKDRFELKHQLMERIGQCTMTCPTTAAFNGLVGKRVHSTSVAASDISVMVSKRKPWSADANAGKSLLWKATSMWKTASAPWKQSQAATL